MDYIKLTIFNFLLCVQYIQNVQAVINGIDAKPDEFPFNGYILLPTNVLKCGAFLIDERHALTAAHCAVPLLKLNPKLCRLILGTNNLKLSGSSYFIQKVHVHPQYVGSPYYHHDIAVLTLSRPVDMTWNIQPITISKKDVSHNETLFSCGFGKNNKFKNAMSEHLQKFNTSAIEYNLCRNMMPDGNIISSQICTFSKSGSTGCYGDSGSPLVNKKKELVGLDAHGFRCQENLPHIFTKVLPYVDFINETIEKLINAY